MRSCSRLGSQGGHGGSWVPQGRKEVSTGTGLEESHRQFWITLELSGELDDTSDRNNDFVFLTLGLGQAVSREVKGRCAECS